VPAALSRAAGTSATSSARERAPRKLALHAGLQAALALVVCFLYAQLFRGTGFLGDEQAWPYLRVFEYLREAHAGHLPVTFPTAFTGRGHAFPFFYPPVAYWITTALAAACGDVVWGVHLSYLASVLFSASMMYAVLAKITRRPELAFLGALAYVTFPYRFFDIFGRAALGESWAFVWYPLILHGLWRTLHERRAVPVSLPLGVAGAVLTHTITALYFVPVAALIAWSFDALRQPRALLRLGLVTLLALGATAWFIGPQQFYLPSVWASDPSIMWTRPEEIGRHRLAPATLLLGVPAPRGLGLWLGFAGLAFTPLVAAAYRPAADRRPQAAAWSGGADQRLPLVCLAIWWAILLVQLYPVALMGWLPQPFRYLQFPWRLQGIAGFVMAVGSTLALSRWPRSRLRLGIVALVAVALLVTIPPSLRRAAGQPQWTHAMLADVRTGRLAGRGLTPQGEYAPLATPREHLRWGAADPTAVAPQARAGARVVDFRRDGDRLTAVVDGPGRLVLPLFAYPFYAVADEAGHRLESTQEQGLISVAVPRGRHTLRTVRRLPLPVWLAFGVSGVAVAGLALVLRRERADRRTPTGSPHARRIVLA